MKQSSIELNTRPWQPDNPFGSLFGGNNQTEKEEEKPSSSAPPTADKKIKLSKIDPNASTMDSLDALESKKYK